MFHVKESPLCCQIPLWQTNTSTKVDLDGFTVSAWLCCYMRDRRTDGQYKMRRIKKWESDEEEKRRKRALVEEFGNWMCSLHANVIQLTQASWNLDWNREVYSISHLKATKIKLSLNQCDSGTQLGMSWTSRWVIFHFFPTSLLPYVPKKHITLHSLFTQIDLDKHGLGTSCAPLHGCYQVRDLDYPVDLREVCVCVHCANIAPKPPKYEQIIKRWPLLFRVPPLDLLNKP